MTAYSKAKDRVSGCLLGLAVGDALGTTLEFKKPGSFRPITDILGGGPFRLKKGQWTDDTSMALCLAESLVSRGGFDAHDQMCRYLKWWRTGYLSATGECFDIGNTIRGALTRFETSGDPFSGSTNPNSAGNGCLMRLAPIPMAFRSRPDMAVHYSVESARTTHGADHCLAATRYFGGLLVGALLGASKETLLSRRYCPPGCTIDWESMSPEVLEVADGSFHSKEPPQIRGSGFVVKSLEAALWAFARSISFQEGALYAVNLGDDADTTGAIYGQLAGAFYGRSGVPHTWIQILAMKERIIELADACFDLESPDASATEGMVAFQVRAKLKVPLNQTSNCFD